MDGSNDGCSSINCRTRRALDSFGISRPRWFSVGESGRVSQGSDGRKPRSGEISKSASDSGRDAWEFTEASSASLYHSCKRLQSVVETDLKQKGHLCRWPFRFSSPSGCGVGALALHALSHPSTRAHRDTLLTSASIARIRMLKMASRLDRRELGDRSVPLRYVAGRRATENNAG